MGEVFQQAFQFLPRGKHAPRKGGFGAAQSFRGLGVALVFINGQHDGGALFRRQPVERLLHAPRKFVGEIRRPDYFRQTASAAHLAWMSSRRLSRRRQSRLKLMAILQSQVENFEPPLNEPSGR